MIDFPVGLNKDGDIVDRNKKVLVVMCWNNSSQHIQKQRNLGVFIVEAMNGLNNSVVEAGEDQVNQNVDNGNKIVEEIKKPKGFAAYWAKKRAKENGK